MATTSEPEARRDAPGDGGRDRAAASGSGGTAPEGVEDPGAWSTAALTLLVVLFVLATAATVHSMIATFGG